MKRAKKAKKRAKAKLRMTTVEVNLEPELRGYVEEIATYACTSVDVVCAVMMACGIFKAKRFELRPDEALKKQLTDAAAENMRLSGLLASCRCIMEANDPGNARMLFGEPQTEVPPMPPGPDTDSTTSA